MEPRPGLLCRGAAFRARPGRPGSTPAQVRTRVVVRRAAGGGARRAAVLARSLWSFALAFGSPTAERKGKEFQNTMASMNAMYLDTLVVTEGI